MSGSTTKWLAEIILAVVTAIFGFSSLVYTYVSFDAMSWNPGLYQIHPLVWAASMFGSVALLYVAYISVKSAKRGGEWRWR